MNVDDRIEELRRAAEKSPEDKAAGALYEAELLRAGRKDTAKERFRFEFLCPVKWEELDSPSRRKHKERFCEQCQKTVYFVDTQADFLRRCEEGACVALIGGEVEERLDDLVEDAAERGEVKRPHCIVKAKRRPFPVKLRGKIQRPT